MAKLRISLRLLVFCVSFVGISNGKEVVDPTNDDYKPLFKYGLGAKAGDNQITNYRDAKEITLDFNITYFGSSYNSIFISKDGLIGFVDGMRYIDRSWSEGVDNINDDLPFMAPFYHDGYYPTSSESQQGDIFYRLIYASKLETEEAKEDNQFSANKQLLEYLNQYVEEAIINPPSDFKAELVVVVTWKQVTDKVTAKKDCDPVTAKDCDSATFQAVIMADKKNTFAMFNYFKMDVPNDKYHQAGFNGGFERGWFDVIPCLGDCYVSNGDGTVNKTSPNDLHKLQGSDYKGRFFFNIGGEEIVRGGCLPPELRAGKLEAYPREVGMFGGEKLEVSGKCLVKASKIYCKFGQGSESFETDGKMTNKMKGYCPVPKMTIRGSVMLSWSHDRKNWSARKKITVVVPKMVDDAESQMSEEDIISWHKRDSKEIVVKWSPENMSTNKDAMVNIKLIGYRETAQKVEFKELENLGEARNREGRFTFRTADHACTDSCEDFQIGLLEVGLFEEYYGDASKRVAIRYGPIPLGWYVDEELTEKIGSDWSDDMCHRWHGQDKKHTDWLNDLPKCPCNLDQALADFGRWQAYPGCDIFTERKCRFHKEAKHCVTSIRPSSSDAGNMCCYLHDGTLMYTQLTFDGGSPSRKHILGVHPFTRPGQVPIMSNMKSDIIPYFHCCYWSNEDSDMCHHFTELRPTTDCDNYEVPGLAFVRGQTHITTFDGSTYQFGGEGDFALLNHEDIEIHGRFGARRGGWDLGSLRKTDRTSWEPTALTHLAIRGSAGIITLHPAPDYAVRKRGLDVLVGNKRYFFDTMSTKWQEFGGAVIINNALTKDDNPHNNFTIITNNVGIIVVAVNNLLQVTVALPPSMMNKGNPKGMGLLGMFDGNRGNDYISRSDTLESPGVRPKTLFENFAWSWAVKSSDSLFLSAKTAKNRKQYYEYADIPHDFNGAPSESQISSTCDDDDYCKWDYRISGSQKVAVATRDADKLFFYSQGSAYKVENCGLPDIGDMAVLSSYNFSAGKEIRVTGCRGHHSFEGEETFKCIQEKVEKAEDEDRDDYGRRMTDNHVKYIIHWVPKPYTICEENDSEGIATAMIIGIVVGVVLVILLIIGIIVLVMKKRKGGSKNIAKPKPADRVRRENSYDDGTGEPMMERDRKPVYNPRRQEARSSSAV